MILAQPLFPELFKGIALFTPGGDVIYCIDLDKQSRWHLHLCAELQEILDLPEPPHFLVPAYTATIDRWVDPYTQQLQVAAELYPPVQRHQALLNAIFRMGNISWQVAAWPEQFGDPLIMETYRRQFPQLWENHELIWEFGGQDFETKPAKIATQNYVFRLFVSGHSPTTTSSLQSLHNLLEQSLCQPYTLKVIDVLKHPEQAEADQISATPTLVRILPQPVRRVVGDLDNIERVLKIITITETIESDI